MRSAPAFMRRAAAVLLFLPLSLAACGDDDDGPTDGGPAGVNGMWEAPGAYMHVSSSAITFYVDFDLCYLELAYEVVDIDGNTYTIEAEGETIEVVLRRSGSNLIVEVDGEESVASPSNVDPDDLTLCQDTDPEDFDPTLGSCAAYPAVTFNGATVSGSLSAADPVDPSGRRFDAYRLQLGAATPVNIHLMSDEIDSHLYLYNSAGSELASNDDSGDGPFDSFIEMGTLEPGCYIVVATSFDPGEAGSYQLMANNVN